MKINPELKPLIVPIDSVRPASRNARKRTKRNLSAIMHSLDKFGQQKPIVVTKDGDTIAGNGTLLGALELGATEIAVVRTNLKNTMDQRAYGIADNRSNELSEWDYEVLAGELTDLKDAYDEDLLGFTAGEQESLLMIDWQPPAGSEDPPEKPKQAERGRSVALNDEQWSIFNQAVSVLREEYGPNLSESEALELMARHFIDTRGRPEAVADIEEDAIPDGAA